MFRWWRAVAGSVLLMAAAPSSPPPMITAPRAGAASPPPSPPGTQRQGSFGARGKADICLVDFEHHQFDQPTVKPSVPLNNISTL